MAFINLGEAHLYYEKYETNKNNDWILFLHGQSSDCHNWVFQSDFFRDNGFNVLLLDLPDSGQSSKFIKRYTVSDLAYLVSEFLQVLNVEKVHVIGHSLGGIIALELSKILVSKNKIMSLVLIGTGIISEKQIEEDKYGDYLKKYMESLSIQWNDDNINAIIYEKIKPQINNQIDDINFYERTSYLANLIFSEELTKKEGYIDYLVESAKQKSNKQDLGCLIRQYLSPISYINSEKDYSTLLCPVLLINGEQDTMIPPKAVYKLASLLENARVVLYPKMKHAAHLELSDEVNELILSFIK